MFKHKYNKYKSKYIQLKKMMYGGDGDEKFLENITYSIFYDKTDDKYKGVAPVNSYKDIMDDITENLAGYKIFSLYSENFRCSYNVKEKYNRTNISTIFNKCEITLVDKTKPEGKGKIILVLTQEDGKYLITNYIYKNNYTVLIRNREISQDTDGKYIISSKAIFINENILINCKFNSQMINGKRCNNVSQINSIIVNRCEFEFSPRYGTYDSIMDLDNVMNLFADKEYSIREQIYSLAPKKILNDEILENVVSLFYNKYVFLNTSKKECNNCAFLRFGNFLSYMIELDIIYFKEHLNSIYKIKDVKKNIINNMIKKIPSQIKQNKILFKKSDGKFAQLTEKYNILFDSGNSTFTLIGRNIVDILKLKVNPGCVKTAGIGGKTTCNGYVDLEIIFSDDFSMNNGQHYKCIAFIGNDMADEIIFGHVGILNQLFKDNYVISKEYDVDDERSKGKEYDSSKLRDDAIKEFPEIKKRLDEYVGHIIKVGVDEVLIKYNNLLNEIMSKNLREFIGVEYEDLKKIVNDMKIYIVKLNRISKLSEFRGLFNSIVERSDKILQ